MHIRLVVVEADLAQFQGQVGHREMPCSRIITINRVEYQPSTS